MGVNVHVYSRHQGDNALSLGSIRTVQLRLDGAYCSFHQIRLLARCRHKHSSWGMTLRHVLYNSKVIIDSFIKPPMLCSCLTRCELPRHYEYRHKSGDANKKKWNTGTYTRVKTKFRCWTVGRCVMLCVKQ